jgi:nitrogen regulatory protein PII 2
MKEITAIIRMDKMNETKRALADAGVYSLTARKVMGRGKGKVDFRLLHGAQEGYEEAINQLAPGPKLIPKRLLTIVAPDAKVDVVISTIISTNKTGNSGDGKIFIETILDAVRVRTGEAGELAISEA